MKFTSKLFFFFLLVIGLNACYYDVEEELYPYTPPENVTYSDNIAPILNANCNNCHSANNANSLGSGIVLDSYTSLKVKVDDGDFPCAVNHNSGCSPMPKGGSKLNANLLSEINTWLAEGALNN